MPYTDTRALTPEKERSKNDHNAKARLRQAHDPSLGVALRVDAIADDCVTVGGDAGGRTEVPASELQTEICLEHRLQRTHAMLRIPNHGSLVAPRVGGIVRAEQTPDDDCAIPADCVGQSTRPSTRRKCPHAVSAVSLRPTKRHKRCVVGSVI